MKSCSRKARADANGYKAGTGRTACAIFEKWDLDFMPIGKVTDTQRLVLLKIRNCL